MTDQYRVKYLCKDCGIERTVSVPWRKPHEPIIQFLDMIVRPAVRRDHQTISALCMSTACDLKLPMDEGSNGVGIKPNK